MFWIKGVCFLDNLLSDGFAYNQTLQKPWVILKLNDQSSWMPYGPFSETEVKDQLKSGELKPTDYCWTSGWSDWKRIYLEPKFYLSRKPPIEINSVNTLPEELKQIEGEVIVKDKKNLWAEIAYRISPKQYMGWKYKKSLQTETHSENYNGYNIKNITDSKDGVQNMLEPWDSKTKSLNFVEEATKDTETRFGATVENYPKEDIGSEGRLNKTGENENLSPRTKGARAMIYALRALLVIAMFFIISLMIYRVYSVFVNQNPINYSMSYFVVEDYMNELPEYLYARTDLKKNQQIKIRVFDLSNKQMRTKNSKAGLMLTSKGTGRMRLPMYAYALEPGVYKVMIEIEDQTIEKEFSITLNEASTENSSVLKK